MAVPGEFLGTVPVLVLVVSLRYGPGALLTLIAGLAAVLRRDPERGRRALAVLRLLRAGSTHRAARSAPRPT